MDNYTDPIANADPYIFAAYGLVIGIMAFYFVILMRQYFELYRISKENQNH